MDLFLSNDINIIDKTSSQSVLALFRVAPSDQPFTDIVAYHSLLNPALEACSMKHIAYLYVSINILNSYSDEGNAFADTRLGGNIQSSFKSGKTTVCNPYAAKAACVSLKFNQRSINAGI